MATTLSKNILDARLRAQLTQCEVAKLIVGGPSWFCQVECGLELGSVTYLLRIAKVLNTTASELLQGVE